MAAAVTVNVVPANQIQAGVVRPDAGVEQAEQSAAAVNGRAADLRAQNIVKDQDSRSRTVHLGLSPKACFSSGLMDRSSSELFAQAISDLTCALEGDTRMAAEARKRRGR